MKEKVEKVLSKIRPYLQNEGGNVELIEVSEGGIVKVKLTGRCAGCPMSSLTFKGIEQMLKKEIPEIKSVEAV